MSFSISQRWPPGRRRAEGAADAAGLYAPADWYNGLDDINATIIAAGSFHENDSRCSPHREASLSGGCSIHEDG
ncbi:hypothetical protein ACFYXC_39330 [Streptomyces sp. NPDC002701]|uniref:hypothetical protein n=1 Tax=Streptomyces sp. NPDC002701 TaxID=3364661 RepID=UPI003696DD0C